VEALRLGGSSSAEAGVIASAASRQKRMKAWYHRQ